MTTSNNKVFSPKIIIGSIMSFIATIVGIIAVFFPDMFNLQKKKIDSIEMEINTDEDVEIFQKFINKKIDSGDIFYIDVMACNPAQSKRIVSNHHDSGIFDPNKETPEGAFRLINLMRKNSKGNFEIIDSATSEVMDTVEQDDLENYIDQDTQYCSSVMCGADDYSFPENMVTIPTMWRFSNGMCENGLDGVRVNGYTYYNGMQGYSGIRFYSFNEVDEKDVKMKNY